MERPRLPALNLAHSSDSSAPSTPKSSYISHLPESPSSPFTPRPASPSGRPSVTPTRLGSQVRARDLRPAYLPFRRISLPSVPDQKRDSVASIFSIDSVQEHDEGDAPPTPGKVSTSLPTESSMPDMGHPLVPPIPASRVRLNSSPSRRVAFAAPSAGSTGANSASGIPSRVRPRPSSTQSLARMSSQSPGRLSQSGGKIPRRSAIGKSIVGEKEREREERRRKIAKELLDTEQTYVDGLDLVYNHFLAPLIESLTTPQPLVSPMDLGVIFPGFIDILNFNRSFLSELRSAIYPPLAAPTRSVPIPIPGTSASSTSPPRLHSNLLNEAEDSIVRPSTRPSTSWNSLGFDSQPSSHSNANLPPSAVHDQEGVHVDQEVGQPGLMPNLASVLAQHVPYLKLYKPFVTAFPASMERLARLSANERFRAWLRDKERDPACGMLGLRSWLLSVVQRCPRYLLMVKDLAKHTDESDEGHAELLVVLSLLTAITGQLNTSLADHTAVLALLELQRNTSSLPPGFSFVAPGRSLVRRGRLRMSGQEVSQGGVIRRVGAGMSGSEGEREVLLFSDCVVWLERELEWGLVSASSASGWAGGAGMGGMGMRHSRVSGLGLGHPTEALRRPLVGRTRSKSEAELPTLKSQGSDLGTMPETARVASGSSSAFVKVNDVRNEAKRRNTGNPEGGAAGERSRPVGEVPQRRSVGLENSMTSEERWRFRGMANLMDVEVVISPRNAAQIDFLSPEGSFALYASTYNEREEWISAIRSSKATMLATFNVIHPDSTLTSSSSTTHLRRVLQALPYPPGEATIRASRIGSTRKSILDKGRARNQLVVPEDNEDADAEDSSSTAPTRNPIPKQTSGEAKAKERRGRVEHYVPAIWVPDRDAPACMRCQAAFGWRRRRHHCRLCGRVVCASCSSKNFFVMDPSNADTSKSRKPERACSLCYETVFPLAQSSSDSLGTAGDRGGTTISPQHPPVPPRRLQYLISTSPVTTPAIERDPDGGFLAFPSATATLTASPIGPVGASPLGRTVWSSSSVSDARISNHLEAIDTMTASITAHTVTSLDSQRTAQPTLSMVSDMSLFTSASQFQSSRPRSLDIGSRLATASAFVHTAGVTARSKMLGKGKGGRVSLTSGRETTKETAVPLDNENNDELIATLGRGAAARQLNKLLHRSPK